MYLKPGVYTKNDKWWYSEITDKWYNSEEILDKDVKLFILKSRKEKLLKIYTSITSENTKKNLINKNDILELIKNKILFIHIKTMENFDPEKFKKYMINSIELDESQKIINDFNENEIDIYNFFSKWNKFFKKQSKKYNQKINRMIDLIINEKQNNSING